MAMLTKIRSASKAADAAVAAGPYARNLMAGADEDVRSTAKHVVDSADHLYARLSGDVRGLALATDDEVRRDVDRIIGSLQDSARSVGEGARGRLDRKALVIGAGLGLAAALLAVALLYPRMRRRIVRVADETRERASTTAREARERVSETVDDARKKASETVDDAVTQVSETVDDALVQVSETVDDVRQKAAKTADKLRGAAGKP